MISTFLSLIETKIAAGTALGTALLMGTAGTAIEMPFLQYGALGVLALALWLGYKVLSKIGADCHSFSERREERLIQIQKEGQAHTDKIMEELIDAFREKKGE